MEWEVGKLFVSFALVPENELEQKRNPLAII